MSKEPKKGIYSKLLLAQSVQQVMKDTKGGTHVNVTVKDHKRAPLAPNVMVFQTFAYLAATKMSPAANRILMLFLAMSQYEGAVSMDVQTIMEELDINSNKTVSVALSQLEGYGVIIKVPYLKDKRRNEYYINPIAAWKGNSEARKMFMRSSDPDQLSLFSVNAADHLAREQREIKQKQALLDKWDEIEKNAIEKARDLDEF
jgi:DNA-binding transcriptional regulator GbsR (MarR family)